MAGRIISVKEASGYQDEKESTDYIIEIKTGTIACRVRAPRFWRAFGDITLRSHRPRGTETELAKIRKGFARWYLYIWAERTKTPEAWVWLDLDRVRASGLIDVDSRATWNYDMSSAFVSLDLFDLWDTQCITGASPSVYAKLGVLQSNLL
jgi:hypothetical protein